MALPTDPKAVALLSGGLDSTVAMTMAHRELGVAEALCVNYGQRTFKQELSAAEGICAALSIPLESIKLDIYERLSAGKLLSLKDKALGEDLDFWVPNRNGLLINIAAAVAEGRGLPYVVVGFNIDEGEAFPDNTVEFMEATNRALAYSTLGRVKLISPTATLSKKEIVDIGRRLGAPLELIYSCYSGEELHCAVCPSCKRLAKAFLDAGAQEIIQHKFKSKE
jgi:7-cyano-7-deazaguanine synthase